MEMTKENLSPGSIVQLDPLRVDNQAFAGCLMIVTEVKVWGVVGYVPSLGSRKEPGGFVFYRAEHGTYANTGGTAVWIDTNEKG